jgi:hypothetical protein
MGSGPIKSMIGRKGWLNALYNQWQRESEERDNVSKRE